MNQFEALCRLASKENWCWNLHCTTCGHVHFRYAFAELVVGKSPEDKSWLIHRRTTNYVENLGTWPRTFNEEQKAQILRICLQANIHSIAKHCKYPDWLGHLGLVLAEMRATTTLYKSLSSQWASQLRDMVPAYSPTATRLTGIIEGDSKLLDIKDLEAFETELRSLT